MAPPAGNTGDGGEATSGEEVVAAQRRRLRREEVQEVVDELAQETKRSALLDEVEKQLKGLQHVSRVLFAFTVTDDKKVHHQVEQEYAGWRENSEEAATISGVLIFAGQAAVHLLEGPTESVLSAMAFFHTLAPDGQAGKPENQRQAIIGPLRVLHFTELRGVRASVSWCAVNHSSRSTGSQVVLDEANCSQMAFATYSKILKLCLKVKEQHEEEAQVEAAKLVGSYRRTLELFPTSDEVLLLLSKPGAELFFSYPEFHQVFTAPLHLALNSELLWPMPPALSY